MTMTDPDRRLTEVRRVRSEAIAAVALLAVQLDKLRPLADRSRELLTTAG